MGHLPEAYYVAQDSSAQRIRLAKISRSSEGIVLKQGRIQLKYRKYSRIRMLRTPANIERTAGRSVSCARTVDPVDLN